ncbi:hypothetical protein [Mariniphaga sediminis]|uniref:hypothetical protein n=1 Tax=Mariniphaga sediminis TaxID=1628158 RepID=UPI0035614C30
MKKQFIECPECGAVQIFDFRNFWKSCPECSNKIIDQHVKPLPALSIRQPWAWLIVRPDLEGEARVEAIKRKLVKDLENRNNLRNFTGPFLIHASIKPDFAGFYAHIWGKNEFETLDTNIPDHLDYGGIIGHAKITGYVEESDSPWFVGKYGLLIKDAKPLPFTPCKGKLSFFKPEIE